MVINLQTKEIITVVYLSPMLHKNNAENLDVLFVMELWLADYMKLISSVVVANIIYIIHIVMY